jgi:uncharacterized membrane protein
MLTEGAADAAFDDGGAAPAGAVPLPGARFRVWRDPVTWAGVTLIFGAYFAISLFRLLRLDAASFDLGVYTEYIKQLSLLHAPITDVQHPGLDVLGDHFAVAVAVIVPFFRLYPSPVTLLFFQALFAAISVFPVTAAGADLVGERPGRLIGLAYGCSWGLQQMALFEFHEIALAVPLLAFSLAALVRSRPRVAVAWAVPLVFVKEDQGFTVAAIGLFLVLSAVVPRGRFSGNRTALRGGAFLAVWGLGWSALAIWVVIPLFAPAHDYYYWTVGGVVGGSGFSISTVVRQALVSWQLKLRTTGLIVFPTVFTALASPVAAIAVPSLALRFVSTNSDYWGTTWHYNATVMPIVFIAAIDVLGRWRRARDAEASALGPPPSIPGSWWRPGRNAAVRFAAMAMAVVALETAFKFPLGSLWHDSTYQLSAQVTAADAGMALLPDGATVTGTIGVLAPLAARADTFWMGNAGNPPTQYIVFDSANPGWGITSVSAYIAQFGPRARYVQIFSRDGVYVFRRG